MTETQRQIRRRLVVAIHSPHAEDPDSALLAKDCEFCTTAADSILSDSFLAPILLGGDEP